MSILALASFGVLVFLCQRRGEPQLSTPVEPSIPQSQVLHQPVQEKAPIAPARSQERRRTEQSPRPRHSARSERLAELEALGSVPSDATPRDWQLAQETSWWGKPVDPQAFWEGRVLWLDTKTKRDANAHGRTFPPIPHGADLSGIPVYQDEGDFQGQRSVDDAGPRFWSNSRERAFWNQWVMKHPRPPSQITKKQLQVAELILSARYDFEHGENIAKHNERSLKKHEEKMAQDAMRRGYPPEAFTADALLRVYTEHKLHEYRSLCDQGREQEGSVSDSFSRSLFIPTEALLEPDENDTNGEWRIPYLKRLRAEGTDETYINAYLDAWNLDESMLTAEGR